MPPTNCPLPGTLALALILAACTTTDDGATQSVNGVTSDAGVGGAGPGTGGTGGQSTGGGPGTGGSDAPGGGPPCGIRAPVPEADDATCANGIDDDCNGFTDCLDFGCSRRDGVSVCCGDHVPEDSDAACKNGLDDDCNGFTDCLDYACSSRNGIEVCCGARSGHAGGEETGDEACADGWDNDCNGFTDCHDRACAETQACCPDGPKPETTPAACADGRDNDCNGYTDCRDFACSRNADVPACCGHTHEDTPEACDNRQDEDCDGLRDCDDPDCRSGLGVEVCPPPCEPSGAEDSDAACADGLDNDCNGYVDCIDFDCSRNAGVSVCTVTGDTEDCRACAFGSECASGHCVSYAERPEIRFCAPRCERDADCPPELARCGNRGFCGHAEQNWVSTCDPDGRGYAVADVCGLTHLTADCAAEETCGVQGDRAFCQPPCIGLYDAIPNGRDARMCCAGLAQAWVDSPDPDVFYVCFRAAGEACAADQECGPSARCRGGVCASCESMANQCTGDADCCDFVGEVACNPDSGRCETPCGSACSAGGACYDSGFGLVCSWCSCDGRFDCECHDNL